MLYRVSVPAVETIGSEENFTRRARVWIRGNIALDIRLDHKEYDFDFDNIEVGNEFKVEAAYQGDPQPECITLNAIDEVGDLHICPYFTIIAQPDLLILDDIEDLWDEEHSNN